MINTIKNLINNYKIKLGYITCPSCNILIKPKFIKDYIYHPDEPPLFYHYSCPKCLIWLSTSTPSILVERAVKQLGFKDFNDYVKFIEEERVNKTVKGGKI